MRILLLLWIIGSWVAVGMFGLVTNYLVRYDRRMGTIKKIFIMPLLMLLTAAHSCKSKLDRLYVIVFAATIEVGWIMLGRFIINILWGGL